jgi:membrane protease YdiL (CAAX protease family)
MQVNLKVYNPILYFTTRSMILGGMVLVFLIAGSALGMILAKFIVGVDFMNNPSLMNNYANQPDVIAGLKIVQSFSAIGGFLFAGLYFPRAIEENAYGFVKMNHIPKFPFWYYATGIFLVSIPVISSIVLFNEQISFPTELRFLEAKFKQAELAATELTQAFTKADTNSMLLINIIVVALIPAISEEVLFRGAFMHFLVKCFAKKHIAVWISAAIFSLIHWQFYGFLPRMLMGVILGYIVLYSKSIWPAICIHFINNALGVISSYSRWNESTVAWLHDDYVFPTYIVVLSSLATITGIYLMSIRYNSIENKHG